MFERWIFGQGERLRIRCSNAMPQVSGGQSETPRLATGRGRPAHTRPDAGKTYSFDDIVIVAPCNAEVFSLADRLPNTRISTVDKFQSQEAPVVTYSTTTSSPGDAPHVMEFLYSINRGNVGTSRARC